MRRNNRWFVFEDRPERVPCRLCVFCDEDESYRYWCRKNCLYPPKRTWANSTCEYALRDCRKKETEFWKGKGEGL